MHIYSDLEKAAFVCFYRGVKLLCIYSLSRPIIRVLWDTKKCKAKYAVLLVHLDYERNHIYIYIYISLPVSVASCLA